ncbi:RNA-directed DNA polymerase, eukaryota, partial [Tanacetum coccineum]
KTKMETMKLVTIKTLRGLIDLPLDGYAYTWVHKTANKMSKVDRFLVSKGLLASFSYLSALCLDRNISDHRHILMQELSIDYIPTPFRFFHSWMILDGFDRMVEDTWKSLATVDLNGMINLKMKLQALKIVIKQWTKNAKKSSYKAKISIQSKLSDIDKILDQGGSNEEILSDRSLLLKELNDINSIDSLEAAQKSKVRWAIEAIRGTLVDGEWIVDPLAVKSVFLKYFSTQLSSPVSPRICFADQLTNRLSSEQQATLDQNVSNEEIKSVPLKNFLLQIDSSLKLSHIFFADDAIFVRKWDSLNICTIANVLKSFHLASGLKINFHKSKLMGIVTRPEEVDAAVTTMGCSILTTPFVYLGVKVGGAISRIKSWDDVVAKVLSRLSK